MKRVSLVLMLFLIFTSFMNLNAQWVRTYRTGSWEIASSVQQTSDGGYIVAGHTGYTKVGDTDYDFWVLKLTPTGTIEWEYSYGGDGRREAAKSIQQTNDGGYIVAGHTESFGAGGFDAWVLKLDSTGIVEWQKTYGGIASEYASSIQQTIDGGYIVAGQASSFSPGPGGADAWVLKLTSGGDIVWQRRYERGSIESASSIHQTSDGGYIVAGRSFTRYAGDNDFWILKLTSIGDIEWQHIYGGIDDDNAHSIRQTSDGGYIVAGFTASFGAGGRDFWVLKLTASGEIEWQRAYGGSDADNAHSIRQTVDGGYIVGGHAEGWNVSMLKLTPAGDIEWKRIYDWDCNEEAFSIQQTNEGGYVVAGTTSPSCENAHFWVLKLLPDGTIDPTCGFIRSSEAIITDTFVSPKSTSVSPQDTNIVPLDTGVISQDTNAYVVLVCDGPKYDFTIYVTAGGTTNPSPGTHTYYIGTVFRIEALADIGYRFSYWTGDVPQGHENDNPITITMDANKSIEANFIRQYTLTTAAGTGGTTNPSPGSHIYDVGTQVSVRAIPNSGYRFTGWSGDASGTDNPITITMDSDKSITANFKKKGGCFIATAAYGSPLHSYVRILRGFRDKYFVPNKLGRRLVDLYYKYSPFFADLITKHRVLKVVVRFTLLPVIVFSYSMVNFGLAITAIIIVFIFMLPIFSVSFFRRKMSQLEAKDH